MRSRISVITLGVSDLQKAVAFYRDGLGFPTAGIVGTEYEHGAVAFFDLENGAKLALWARADLAHDAGVSNAPGNPAEFSLGYNVNSRSEVDLVFQAARDAGAQIVKPPRDTFYGGYAGYFADPDGHLWEIVWNPQFVVDSAQGDAG